jgi:hypothetical protein
MNADVRCRRLSDNASAVISVICDYVKRKPNKLPSVLRPAKRAGCQEEPAASPIQAGCVCMMSRLRTGEYTGRLLVMTRAGY